MRVVTGNKQVGKKIASVFSACYTLFIVWFNHKEELYMAIVHGTDQNFSEEVAEGLVLVDFWATWCGPCKMIAPVLEELDAEMSDKVKIVKVDVDQNQETAGNYGIMSIPTLLLMKNGETVDKVVGFRPKEALAELVEKHA